VFLQVETPRPWRVVVVRTARNRTIRKVKKQENERMAQQHGNTGNFADNPERAAQAGRKGGEHSHSGSASHNAGSASHGHEKAPEKAMESSHKGSEHGKGTGNFANDREKASEAGRAGGQHSHGGRS
jgi:general stress protein YciG